MAMIDRLLDLAQTTVDAVADRWPSRTISQEKLVGAKIVAHRGAFGPGSKENRVASLVECARAGIWGVEFDVRWDTSDVPVLLHGPLPNRSMADRLADAIAALAGRCHLMIEVKESLNPPREAALKALLQGLEPIRDYHLLTLDPELLKPCHGIPKECWVLVTETRVRWASDFVLANRWGGVAGHYLLLSDRIIARHHEAGQRVGVGFIASPNNLCRQLARNVDWIFTNHGPLLQKWIKARIEN